MNYEEWEKSVSVDITADSLWKMTAYRLALFLSDLGWYDATKLTGDRRTAALADQLNRALGSIGANLAEGYSRGTGRDRARFYQYALGSARESRDWYFKGRHVLGEAVVTHRTKLLVRVIQLLLTTIPQQRESAMHEHQAEHRVEPTNVEGGQTDVIGDDEKLLQRVPLPAPFDV